MLWGGADADSGSRNPGSDLGWAAWLFGAPASPLRGRGQQAVPLAMAAEPHPEGPGAGKACSEGLMGPPQRWETRQPCGREEGPPGPQIRSGGSHLGWGQQRGDWQS